MTIVHSKEVHSLMLSFCGCSNTGIVDQLFDAQLFPATVDRLQTAFTFDVLDLFMLDYTVCKTSAMLFTERLRHLSDPVSPHNVLVCSHARFLFTVLIPAALRIAIGSLCELRNSGWI
jgi:hypothetical protein